MILTKQNLAIGLVGLASLTWVGVSSALEAGDPVLDDEVVVVQDDCADEAVEDECTTDVDADENEVTEPTEAESLVEESAVAEDEQEGAETEAVEHPENHGKYVSEAARETCPAGPGHGQCVRAVAQSDAGKHAADDEGDALEGDDVVDESTEDADEAEIEVEAEDDVEGATAPAARGAGNGRGNGKGKG